MAKIKCPGCGAKNTLDAHRCRICTAMLNPDIPEGDPVDPAPGPRPASLDAGELARQTTPGQASFGGDSGLGARIAATGNLPSAPADQLGARLSGEHAPWSDFDASNLDEPAFEPRSSEPATFDPSELGVPTAPPPDAPPPTAGGSEPFEPFDLDALYDTPPSPPSPDEASSPSPTDSFEPFDPDALFRDS